MKRLLIIFALLCASASAQILLPIMSGSPAAGNSCGGTGSIPAGAALVFETRSGQLGDSCSAHNPCQNGDAMDQWKDQSGNARNLTPVSGGSATYTTSVFGSVASAKFNGTTSDYTHTNLDFNVATLCAVIKNDAANNVGTLFAGGANTLDYRTYATGGKLHELLKAGVALIGQSTTTYDTSVHLVCATYDGTTGNAAFYTDGSAAGTASGGPAITTLNGEIGANSGAELYKGDIGMLLAYQSVLSGANLTAIHQYACTNYGTP